MESCPPQSREILIYRATEILAFSRLLCSNSPKATPTRAIRQIICHPIYTQHFNSYDFERHEALPLSPSRMEKHSSCGEGCVPSAALHHGTHPEADLSLRHWPGTELLISFRLKRLLAAKTSLPKDNFIILIIRRPVMIKCLLLASV